MEGHREAHTSQERNRVIPEDCKCLAEVDFPLAEVSRHAVRKKSIRHGHSTTLRLWRRTLASSRASLQCVDERRVAEDRRDCYWPYVVTNCGTRPQPQEPIRDPARVEWHEVTKMAHCYLPVDALTHAMQVREESSPHGSPGGGA
jgi:hypothetical protein